MENKSGGRGGYRAGAGRKSTDGVVMHTIVTASVDKQSYDLIQQYGGGNNSLGVRKICALLAKLQSTAKPSPRAAGGATVRVVKMPVYKEPDEYTPDGSRRNIVTMTRLRREAEATYKREMEKYELMTK